RACDWQLGGRADRGGGGGDGVRRLLGGHRAHLPRASVDVGGHARSRARRGEALPERMSSGNDPRELIYADLHGQQLERQETHNRVSAHVILPILFERFKPRSLLDVGCGLGTWLSVAKELGVAEIAGVEGAWLDRKLARV